MKSRLRLNLILGMILTITLSASAQKHIEAYDPEALFDEGVLLFQNQEYGAALSTFAQYRSQVIDAKSQRCVDAQYYEAVSSLYLGHADGPAKVIQFVNDNPGSTWARHANFLYANHLFKEKKYKDAKPFSEGLAPVKDGEYWGYIDKTGKMVIPATFESADEFSEGLACVQKDGKYGYVDKKGNVNKHGTNVFLPGTFVRPAIWIRPKEPLTVLKTAALRTENSDGWRDWKYEEYRKSLVVNPFFKLEGTHRKGAIRSDEEMASVDKENAEASFKKQKKILTDFMKEHGFIKYKTNAYIRRNECDVLEYLNLQKEKYGSKTLTINYALIPLYIPHDFISFDLGGRLGELICGNDVWWDYANDSLAETGFRNIIKAIDEILLPWFDNHASSEALKLELQKMKSVGYSISRIQQNWLDLLLQDRPFYDPEIIRRNLEMFGIPNIQKRKTP